MRKRDVFIDLRRFQDKNVLVDEFGYIRSFRDFDKEATQYYPIVFKLFAVWLFIV